VVGAQQGKRIEGGQILIFAWFGRAKRADDQSHTKIKI
jgi:hypothetical protein